MEMKNLNHVVVSLNDHEKKATLQMNYYEIFLVFGITPEELSQKIVEAGGKTKKPSHEPAQLPTVFEVAGEDQAKLFPTMPKFKGTKVLYALHIEAGWKATDQDVQETRWIVSESLWSIQMVVDYIAAYIGDAGTLNVVAGFTVHPWRKHPMQRWSPENVMLWQNLT